MFAPTRRILNAFLPYTLNLKPHASRVSIQSAIPVERMKDPKRGGQNLSERAQRLERMLREKEAFSQDVYHTSSPFATTSIPTRPWTSAPQTVTTFRGLVIPEKPREPEADECCMSGCAVCVYDLYEESLSAYTSSLKTVQASLTAMDIPTSEWPESIRPLKEQPRSRQSSNSVSLSAFEQMERALKAKREVAANAS
ncbi:hypothetical protein BV25DRAFT_1822377 [Artomyces pyxidatus]|uniref:Uncharacterized protein n=1 Tax=Artomyces pyxidatus TaxID=48021 RepID=A0ACB8TAP4_9AGAM|nr:hypothetical protein BV25DRAFT_1822377 [Artomyces pyxidatus]